MFVRSLQLKHCYHSLPQKALVMLFLSEQEINICEIVTVEPLRPLSVTRDTSNAILSEQEINYT